jgi:AcrR family transcriptional regulator
MPKAFSEREREIIKSQLIETGKRLFSIYGIKKTNVEDITKECGIAKGSFYLFFPSKEELFMDILESIEIEIKTDIAAALEATYGNPRGVFKTILKQQFQAMEDNPLLSIVLNKDEYSYLLRKLPPHRINDHIEHDDNFTIKIIRKWRAEGVIAEKDDKLITGILKACFFMLIHKQEIGEDIFPQVLDTLLELVTNHIIKDTSGGDND